MRVRRFISLFLSLMMIGSLLSPAAAMTIAVVETEQDGITLSAAAGDLTVKVFAPETAGIPKDAALKAEEIPAEDYLPGILRDNERAVLSRFAQISILDSDGNEIEPEDDVEVSLSFDAPAVKRGSLRVVHFPAAGRTRTGARMNGADGTVSTAALTSSDDGNPDGDGPAYEELSHALTEENGRSTVTFSTGSFSVYGIVYTVDLFWFDEENGRRTEYSLPGGGGISLGELLSRLGVAWDDPETAENELSAFLDTVEAVTFSDPALVWTGYADSDTTVGELKASRGLACDYSAELTEEERAELDGYAVSAGDWALIALKAFSTEEKLTVVRTDGEVLELLVTDAQGDSPYRIEYTWSEWWTSTAKVNVCYYDDKNKRHYVSDPRRVHKDGGR